MFGKDTQEKRSLRELRQELKKRKSLEVEIMSLSTGEIVYECPKTRYKFNLSKLGAKESVELDVLTTLVNRSRGFFENHLITIVDFEDEEFTVEKAIEYAEDYSLRAGLDTLRVEVDEIPQYDEEGRKYYTVGVYIIELDELNDAYRVYSDGSIKRLD